MQKFHIALNDILEQKNISKQTLIRDCHLQRMQVNRYCNNQVNLLDLRILGCLCRYLDCTPNDLLVLQEVPDPVIIPAVDTDITAQPEHTVTEP